MTPPPGDERGPPGPGSTDGSGSGPTDGSDSGPADGPDSGSTDGSDSGPTDGPDSRPGDGPDSGPTDGSGSGSIQAAEGTPSLHASGTERPAAAPVLPVHTVLVVGLGLMGGSLARSLRSHPAEPEVLGLTADGSEGEAALAEGAVSEVVRDSGDALARAELVVYATPLSAVLDLMEAHHGRLRPDALVTDVASLKAPVVQRARALGLEDRYVGSHPLTGGEGSGFRASRPGIYRGSTVWLTEDMGTREAQRGVESFWRALGAEPAWTAAEAHDRRMAWVSHLPQLVANALARALEGAGVQPSDLGPGGRDMTRLAASSPRMWRDLLSHAAAVDSATLHVVAGELQALATALENGRYDRVATLMEETRRWRMGGPVP